MSAPNRGAGLVRIRLVHPFPSVLNGLTVLVIAMLAGGSIPVAVRLALAMTAFQFAIGSLNDLVDAPRDAGRDPPKPIAAGLISASTARLVVVTFIGMGIALTVPSGLGTVAVGLAGLSCGIVYDLRLSRSAASWLPLAVALPLVPVFASIGVSGRISLDVLALVPLAMLAGSGLAIGNALVDEPADRGLGRRTVAVALGRRTGWLLHSVLFALTIVLLGLVRMPAGGPTVVVPMVAGIAGIVSGAALLAMDGNRWKRAGWALEAAGTAMLGVTWFIGPGTGSG